MPKEHPVAQFRNVSGVDRHLSLPEWLAPRLVEADAVAEVDDDLAAKYDFNQPGVWERLDGPSAPEVETPADVPAEPVDKKNGSN